MSRSGNVGEATKKPETWAEFRDLSLDVGDEWGKGMKDGPAVVYPPKKSSPESDEARQVVAQVSAAHWFSLSKWAKERGFLQGWERSLVFSLGRLAATMAHEFNNVLMGIAPFADLLLRSSEARTQTAARHIKTSIGRGKRVTEEILQYTRQAPPTLSRVDVTDWLDSLRPELRIMLPASVTLSVAVRPGVGSMVAEATQMSQVISNLVLNARDALPDGGLNCDYS